MKLDKIVLTVLLILFAAYFCAIFFLPGTNYTFYIKPLLIPVFMTYAILKNGFVFHKRYLFFVFLFYIGQILILFSDHSNTVLQLALVFYVMFYFALINLVWPQIKDTQFKKIFTLTTVTVFLINALLLFLIVYLIFESTTETITNFITVLNAILALMLMITAVVYLSIDTNKKSILYFFGAISLILSDVFAALNIYYFGIFELNVLDLMLHFIGFYLIYLFIIEKTKPNEIDYLSSN